MKLLRINATAAQDMTQMVSRCTWSGDIQSCSRCLELELVSLPDVGLPDAPVELGDRMAFYDDGQLFDGFVFSIQTGTNDRTKTVRCYDRGIYLNNCQGYYRFQNTTPEAVAKTLAGDFGFSLGEIFATGHRFSRNFLGQSVYKILATAYTLASASTGDRYHIAFELDKLTVRKKQQDQDTLVIRGSSNLLSASVTESIENLVNRVRVVDDSYQLVTTQEDAASIARYGALQRVLRQSENSTAEAKSILEDNGPSQKITMECIGDTRCIAGRMAAVQEPYTGIWGLFWIDADSHTWADGIYTNKLTLNFKNIMNEQEVGSLPDE